ncbi:MAG: Triosephosphate isomerase, bacterial/eukaryotic [Gemmatimonadetes bacterium]|nr:Triosephosphate isomerase, bacterial/eukaryotic [Gemmatimonadota bacterium]
MALRKPVLAGNWKMTKGPTETVGFFADFLNAWMPRDDRTVVFFPSDVSLAAALDATADRPDVLLGVQNVHWERSGAFTGETSVGMAADAGAKLVLVGHSERRHVFGETDGETAKKVRAVLDGGLIAVLCVGETIGERRAGDAEAVVRRQLAAVLPVVSAQEVERLVVAYEPVWAIGTGETASPADAGAMHRVCRDALAQAFGREAGDAVPVLYGGSVKPDNAAELLREPGVDGVLVGGASLDPAGFAAICGAAAG